MLIIWCYSQYCLIGDMKNVLCLHIRLPLPIALIRNARTAPFFTHTYSGITVLWFRCPGAEAVTCSLPLPESRHVGLMPRDNFWLIKQ